MGIYQVVGGATNAAPSGTLVEVLVNQGIVWPSITNSGTGGTNVFIIPPNGVNAMGPGSGSFFNNGYGAVPGVPPGATGMFQVRTWLGAPSYEAALFAPGAFHGLVYSPWNQTTGTTPVPPGTPAILAMGGKIFMTQNAVPEPSTITLGILGGATLLLRRRRTV